MEYIEKGSFVYKKEEVVTKTQTAIVETFHDNIFNIGLNADKAVIIADGVNTATITATIYNYLEEPQIQNIDIIFELDGQEQIVTAVDGVASITFNTEVAGEYTFTANVPNYRSGEVKVVAE